MALILVLLLLTGCAATPSRQGLSQTMPPRVLAQADQPRFSDYFLTITDDMTDNDLFLMPSDAARRDQQHQHEFDEANLARYVPLGLLTLVVCMGLVWLISVGQDWWGRRQRNYKEWLRR